MITIRITGKHVVFFVFFMLVLGVVLAIPSITASAVIKNPGHLPSEISWESETITSRITIDGTNNGISVTNNGSLCIEKSNSDDLGGCITKWEEVADYLART